MFESLPTIHAHPDPRDPGSAESCLADLDYARFVENTACHRKIQAALELWERRILTAVDAGADEGLAGSDAFSEISTHLRCSHTTARGYVEGGSLLLRMPVLADTAAHGEIDYANLRMVTSILGDDASVGTLALMDEQTARAAVEFTPSALRAQVWKLWLQTAPEEAAEARRRRARTDRCAYVRRAGNGLSWLAACLTDVEGSEADALLTEITATVCTGDPRSRASLRADGLMALLHGEAALVCQCGGSECPKQGEHPARRRNPLVQVIVDAQTLLGVTDTAGTLADGTPVDAEVARALAECGTWQAIITETRAAVAESSANTTPGAGNPSAAPVGAAAETEPGVEVGADAALWTGNPSAAAIDETADTATDLEVGTGSSPTMTGTSIAPADTARAEAVAADCEATVHETRTATAESTPEGEIRTTGEVQTASDGVGGDAPVIADDARVDHSTVGDWPAGDAVATTDAAARLATALADIEARFGGAQPPQPPSVPRERKLLARGRTHTPGLVAHALTCAAAIAARRTPATAAQLIDYWTDTLDRHPELAEGPSADGHGGLSDPPPGALTYQPRAQVAALVRAQYPTCDYPGCTVAARRCELDHVVPFDHEDPARGGWTIPANLHPLCKRHHDLKSHRYWTCTTLPGGAHHWRHHTGIERITVPDNRFGLATEASPEPNSGAAQSTTDPLTAAESLDLLYEETWWERHMAPADHPGNDPTVIAHYRQHQSIVRRRQALQPAPF